MQIYFKTKRVFGQIASEHIFQVSTFTSGTLSRSYIFLGALPFFKASAGLNLYIFTM